METILEMTLIDWLVFILAISSYAPLVIGVIRQEDKSQTALTWFLYLALDTITMFSSKEADGNYVILFGFAVGSLIMTVILLHQRRINWTWLETLTVSLIIICIIIWKTKGSYLAVIAGILSESIVGIYLIIKTFKNPVVKYNLFGYIGFLITSIVAMIAAEDFSIPQFGFAFCETILNVIILFPLIREWSKDWILKWVAL